MKDLDSIHSYLKDVTHRDVKVGEQSVTRIKQLLSEVKQELVVQGNQAGAKTIWCYEQILKIQNQYLDAFQKLKSEKFYDGWCSLERVEIEQNCLHRHLSIKDDEYMLRFIEKHTQQLQTLFPYKYFISPGMLIPEAECSICHKRRSIRKFCGHILGDIYDGEMCVRHVKNASLLEVSLVQNPAQKYSVLFSTDSKTGDKVDHYDYSLVRYVTAGLRKPFDGWDMEWTKSRHPHSRYRHLGRNDQCPCESGKKYKKCCLNETGVLRPHLEIKFLVPPPETLAPLIYT